MARGSAAKRAREREEEAAGSAQGSADGAPGPSDAPAPPVLGPISKKRLRGSTAGFTKVAAAAAAAAAAKALEAVEAEAEAPGPTLASLPDSLLQQIVLRVGLREAYGDCRLPHVCRRLRAAALAVEWPTELALVARARCGGTGGATPKEVRRWAKWIGAGRLRLQALRVDVSEGRVAKFTPFPKFWTAGGRPVLACLGALTCLRRLRVRHGDVAPPSSRAYNAPAAARRRAVESRHEYVAALLAAAAPSAAVLEELALSCGAVPEIAGPAREAFLAGVGRLTALRRLDVAGYCPLDAPLARELGGAAPALAALRATAARGDGAVPAALAAALPSLEELELEMEEAALTAAAAAALGRLPRLRRLALQCDVPEGALAAFGEALPEGAPLQAAHFGGGAVHAAGLPRLARAADLSSLALGLADPRRAPPVAFEYGGQAVGLEAPLLAPFERLAALALALRADGGGAPAALAAAAALPALASLALSTAGPCAALAAALDALAGALERRAGPPLRLALAAEEDRRGAGDADGAALQAALGRLARAAAPSLVRLDWKGPPPGRAAAEALAACRGLRRVRLELARAGAEGGEGLEAGLAPLAALAGAGGDPGGEEEPAEADEEGVAGPAAFALDLGPGAPYGLPPRLRTLLPGWRVSS